MEHTQWAKDAVLPNLAAEHRDALAEEMADIAILLTYLARDLRLDLETAVPQKLVEVVDLVRTGSNQMYVSVDGVF